jgi:hypothetical protein
MTTYICDKALSCSFLPWIHSKGYMPCMCYIYVHRKCRRKSIYRYMCVDLYRNSENPAMPNATECHHRSCMHGQHTLNWRQDHVRTQAAEKAWPSDLLLQHHSEHMPAISPLLFSRPPAGRPPSSVTGNAYSAIRKQKCMHKRWGSTCNVIRTGVLTYLFLKKNTGVLYIYIYISSKCLLKAIEFDLDL